MKALISSCSLDLFARDLKTLIMTPQTDIPIDILNGDDLPSLENITVDAMTKRLAKGDKVFVATKERQPVAYVFTSITSCPVVEVKKTIMIAPGECYFYDAFTYPEYRGHGIYPILLDHAARFYGARSFLHALIFSLSHNYASTHGIRKAGFTQYGTLSLFSLLGIKFWRYNTENGRIQSYFNDHKKASE